MEKKKLKKVIKRADNDRAEQACEQVHRVNLSALSASRLRTVCPFVTLITLGGPPFFAPIAVWAILGGRRSHGGDVCCWVKHLQQLRRPWAPAEASIGRGWGGGGVDGR